MSIGGVDPLTGLPAEITLYVIYGQAKRFGFVAYDDEGQPVDLTVPATSITVYVKRAGRLNETAELFTITAAGLTALGDYYVDVLPAHRAFMSNGDALYYTTMLSHSAYPDPLAIGRGPLVVEPSAYTGP